MFRSICVIVVSFIAFGLFTAPRPCHAQDFSQREAREERLESKAQEKDPNYRYVNGKWWYRNSLRDWMYWDGKHWVNQHKGWVGRKVEPARTRTQEEVEYAIVAPVIVPIVEPVTEAVVDGFREFFSAPIRNSWRYR